MATLLDLRTRFYNRFDSGQAGYIGTVEANNLINEGARHLHNWVVSEAEYYIWKEGTITLQKGVSDYFLPPDFQKLLKVFAPQGNQLSGQAINWRPIDRIMPEEYRGVNMGSNWGPMPQVVQAYMLMGQTIRIMPVPPANPSPLLLWYAPVYKDLVNDTDVSAVSNDAGWEEFIVNQAVIGARIKEESDTSALESRQGQIMNMIQSSIINRDMGKRAHVIDVDRDCDTY